MLRSFMAREALGIGKTVDMVSLIQIKNILSSQRERLFKKYHVASMAVFGSHRKPESFFVELAGGFKVFDAERDHTDSGLHV